MSKKLFVGSISFKTTEDHLTELFSTVGKVESAKVINDSATGRSKGFGFVEMTTEEEAKQAIEKLNGSTFMERTIVVNEAHPQQPKGKRDFGGGEKRGFGKDRDSGFNRGRR